MNINIATAFNEKYVGYACTMIMSLLVNQLPEDHVTIYALHNDVTKESQGVLHKLIGGYNASIEFIYIDKSELPSRLRTSEEWSLETYFRLLLFDKIYGKVDTIMYLDPDVIVNGSLRELFELSWDECCAYACADTSPIPFPDKRQQQFAKEIEAGMRYFCAGVMLINVNKVRDILTPENCWKCAEMWNYQMFANDQDILNYYLWDKVVLLDNYRYEVFASLAYKNGRRYVDVRDNSLIVHYVGNKPWDGRKVHFDIEKLWWDYAKLTPYYSKMTSDFVEKCVMNGNIWDICEALEKSADEKKQIMAELQNAVNLSLNLMQQLNDLKSQ